MASEKLTNTDRQSIVSNLLAHRFRVDFQDIARERALLAHRIYENVYDAGQRVRMGELSSGWLPLVDGIKVHLGSGVRRAVFNGSFEGVGCALGNPSDKVFRPVLYCDHNSVACTYAVDHELTIAWDRLAQRLATAQETMSRAASQVRTVLNSCSTSGVLLRKWPEVEPFLPARMGVKPTLPALPTAQLNSMLGLPITTES